MSPDQFRHAMRLFPTGVTVITVPSQKGVTISSLTSVSLTPPQILFCLREHASLCPLFQTTDFFAVNFLSADQLSLANTFTTPALVDWTTLDFHPHAPTGCPLLANTLGYLICERGPIYEGGDHKIILGTVTEAQETSRSLPLVRYKGNYHTTKSS